MSPEQAAAMYAEFKDIYAKYPQEFGYDNQAPTSPALYDAWIFLELMLQKLPFLSEFVGEQVFPTYCYARHYKNGATLVKHTDRPACEVSISAHLGGDADWKLFFEKPNGEEVGLNLKPGQAAVYLGCVTNHWREGGYQGQEYGRSEEHTSELQSH